MNLADIRKEYMLSELDEEIVGEEPLSFFNTWFLEAEKAEITDVNAMTLATVDALNTPHARTVLLKELDDAGFVFYTNYLSAKGNEMKSNVNVALLFYWKELERQVRIEGTVEKVTDIVSDTYFNSRPEGSKLGAWSSPQSSVIPHRKIIETNYAKYAEEFSNLDIPRPPHWGGYRVIPKSIEFWQGRANRMHDRILFTFDSEDKKWYKYRLAP